MKISNHKKQILLAALGYFSSVAILLSFVYWFLKNEGFSEVNFLMAVLLVLILAGGWGYIISSHVLAPKAELDANLSHLSSEILHELNIPVATIKANVSMLKKHLQKEERSLKRLERIEASSDRLERLYEELVYSIQKEIHPIEKEDVNLYHLLHERIEAFESFGRNSFHLDVDEMMIRVDRIGFEKMIDNLLMNAMKYSDKTSLISVVLDGDVLTIGDEGVGMDEAELLKVYERYYQSDRKKEGKGIGLALVKAYCDDEEIEIQIRSKKGEGTRVLLDLGRVHV
ncbi:sensor histidine kinase [Sulfurovum sp. NBC37-1]|uniref:sensor histidine kinase n=1 Tax=Sulfurovum sp. (strain NBC37-1) TaxID=387093 RepID=UPI0001587C67|nr:HAMP domain-containing sensor histidine kinase [Sulfurovum sp. NBC37-1]BAF73126.1 two-component sensor histidine kinase [Sulfurovum sp. NBC37-1]